MTLPVTLQLLTKNEEIMTKCNEHMTPDYRKTILAYYGYEEAEFQVPLKKVIKPFFFFAVMSALYEIGLFDCSLQGLADTLYLSFDLGKMRTTCRRSFYDILPQYEFLFDYFKDLKDTGKIEK